MRLISITSTLHDLKIKARYYFIFFSLLVVSQILYGQENSSNKKSNKNTVTIEVFGHCRSLFSLNYERLFKLQSDYFFYTLRTGLGYSPGITIKSERHKGTVTIPLVVSVLAGKNKHYAQLCIGYSSTFGHAFVDSTTSPPTIYQKFESTYSISLGYRYMWNSFVAQIYPLLQWTNNPTSKFAVGFGVSIGGTF